ncbi:MAG: hypothetical protein ACREBG_04340 [Pyrinomonadaceae bacterium]
MDGSRLRLFQILIAKSIAETLLVGTLAVIFFYTTFPPYFHGWGEASPEALVGWVVNDSRPWDRVEVQLFIDGKFIANGVANLPRPDVMAAGWSKDEWHGYAFFPPRLAAGMHEARVYAIHESGGGVRQTLQLVGNPIRFASDESGKLADLTNLKP